MRTCVTLSILIVLLLGCEDTRRARRRDRDEGRARTEHKASAAAVKVARARCAGTECLPDVTFVDTDGNRHTRDDLDDKVVILNFWASWNGPTQREVPMLSRIADQYRGTDVVILGISIEAGDDAAIGASARQLGMRYSAVRADTLIGQIEPPANIPTTWIYDRWGKREREIVGVADEAELLDLIEDLLDS